MKKTILFLIMLMYCSATSLFASNNEEWKINFEKEVNWMQISDAGILIVCTDDALYGINPDNGEELWKREDQKKIDKEYVEIIDVTPIILITRKGLRNETIAVNTLNGDIVFSTKDFDFQLVHGVMPVYKNLTFLVAGVSGKSRAVFYNVDMKTGKVNWRKEDWMGPKMGDPQLVKLNQSKNFSKTGILGNQYPVFDTENTFFAHLQKHHLAKYDINTGEMIWQADLGGYKIKPKAENASAPALNYAQMIYREEDNTLYMPYSNSLIAVDASNGTFKWSEKLDDFKGHVTETEFTDNGILVKTSGEKPILTLIDYQTGMQLWEKEFKKFQDNGVLLFEEDKILLLTGNDLYSINPQDGSYDILAKNIKFTKEFPSMMSKLGGKLILTADQNIMALDGESYEKIYHHYLAAPGLGAIEIAARAVATMAVNMASYAGARHRAMNYGTSVSNTFEYDVVSANLGQRFSKSMESNRFHYMNTKELMVDGKKQKGVACFDKTSGEIVSQVALDKRSPEYEVDEIMKLLFYKSEKSEITCYKL